LRPRQNLSWLFTRQESANRYEYKFRYLTEQHCLSNSQVPRQQMELSTTFWNAIILVKFFTFFLKINHKAEFVDENIFWRSKASKNQQINYAQYQILLTKLSRTGVGPLTLDLGPTSGS
jgi:hypothetical protein